MTGAREPTDDGLIRRMMAGDEEGFTILYRRRQPSLYRFALHMSGNPAVAEDVTQEVFMTLIRDPRRFDPSRGTVGAYLFGIARNHLRKRWEQEQRLVPLAGDSDGLGSLASGGATLGPIDVNGNGHQAAAGWEGLSSMEMVQRVRKAIRTLPANYREVVVLCELEEMSYEQAATALDCPVGTVRSRLHRARAILLEKLRDTEPAPRASAVGE